MSKTPTDEDFNKLKDRLIAATGSPGLTSFHNGKVHMTLSEWERLITIVEDEKREVKRLNGLTRIGKLIERAKENPSPASDRILKTLGVLETRQSHKR